MKNFLKLLNFELKRFMKLYFVLLIVIFMIQGIGTVIKAASYMKMVTTNVIKGGMSQQAFLDTYAPFSMLNVIDSMWFIGPILIGGTALLFYLFFIWYRDWFAKNTFIYRLLMLPTSRMNLFYSKAATIMLTVLGLVALQIGLILIQKTVIKWIVPKAYRLDVSIVDILSSNYELSIIFPKGFMEFILTYGLGFSFVVVIFTAILFERSYKLKGMVIGVLYACVAFVLFILPLIVQVVIFGDLYLYPNEVFFVELFLWLVITGCSLWISRYLLNHKVTV